MTTTPKLEVPEAMRDFADQSVSQARKAFDTFMTNAQDAITKMEDGASTAQATGTEMQKDAMAFAEEQVASAFDLAQKMVRAKDTTELMTIQANYMRQQMEAVQQQAQDVGSKMSAAAQDAAKSMKT
ncbi:MAG: phasin family protein [Devosiaceae bacterium]|nr:phasin family protein [Devosiaceae bacterium MH13]